MDIKDLIKKVETLDSQNWEVNLEIMKLLGFANTDDVLDGTSIKEKSKQIPIINYTGSIDCAISLFKKGQYFKGTLYNGYSCKWVTSFYIDDNRFEDVYHEQFILSILLAALTCMSYQLNDIDITEF